MEGRSLYFDSRKRRVNSLCWANPQSNAGCWMPRVPVKLSRGRGPAGVLNTLQMGQPVAKNGVAVSILCDQASYSLFWNHRAVKLAAPELQAPIFNEDVGRRNGWCCGHGGKRDIEMSTKLSGIDISIVYVFVFASRVYLGSGTESMGKDKARLSEPHRKTRK